MAECIFRLNGVAIWHVKNRPFSYFLIKKQNKAVDSRLSKKLAFSTAKELAKNN